MDCMRLVSPQHFDLCNDEYRCQHRQCRHLDSRTTDDNEYRFSHRKTVRACKPASFWWEKRDTVVNLVRGFALFRAVDVQLLVKLNFIF